MLPLRRAIVLLCVLLAVIVGGWLWWRNSESNARPQVATAPMVEKQPASATSRTFDPAAPPADMPPMAPGELAVCDSNFTAAAVVSGESRTTDATHAIVTITRVAVTLQLAVTIWVPTDASDHVAEHEDGHRQISEYYYQTADKLAAQIAAKYMGKKVSVVGADLGTEITKMLQQMGAEITDEYNKELNPEPIQLRYDTITDHSRNDISAKDAVAEAIRETTAAPAQPATNPGMIILLLGLAYHRVLLCRATGSSFGVMSYSHAMGDKSGSGRRTGPKMRICGLNQEGPPKREPVVWAQTTT